jgi:hypothetical protein
MSLDGVSLFVIHDLFVVVLVVIILIALIVFVILVLIVGDDVDAHRMDLNHLKLGGTFRAGEDLAFFHFFFVYVHFDSALWATDHGKNLPGKGLDKN